MVIMGLQRLTLLDYPEHIACTLFAKGCNLACPFCHNESLLKSGGEGIGKELLTDFLTSRQGILEGVCLSGGEPLMHKDALEFLEYLKGFGFKIKLDTNGCFPHELELAINRGLVDYIAMDVKSSKENYSLAAGTDVDLKSLSKSVEIIMNSQIDYEFRTTAVKGLHTNEDFEKIADWIENPKRYFIQQLVNPSRLDKKGCFPFSKEEMQGILEIVKAKIPVAMLRGI